MSRHKKIARALNHVLSTYQGNGEGRDKWCLDLTGEERKSMEKKAQVSLIEKETHE
jgi:hypothetical protein